MFRACWTRKQVMHWKKQIRRLARTLGEARDHDVMIEFLAASLAGVSDRTLVPGIASLLNHFERRRQRTQPRIRKAVDRWEARGALKAMQACVRPILEEAGDAEFVAGDYVRGQAGKSLRQRLARLLDEAAGLADPDQLARHHAMRIAAKRLRYTLELARPVYPSDPAGSELANTAEAIKKLQTLLGEIHDCDVWVENFEAFARRESGEIETCFGSSRRFERVRPGLDYLRQERKDRRRTVFGELAAFWQELKDQGVWDRLAALVDEGARSASRSARRNHAKVGGVVRDQSEVVNPGGCGNHQIHGADFNTGAP